MKILVTGAAGFIGSHAAERLSKMGFEVVGVDNFSDYYSLSLKRLNEKALSAKDIDVLDLDLRKPKDVNTLSTDFEFIIHFAAQPGISASSSFEDYFTNNFLATKNLIDFSLKNKNLKHFINIGTSSIYGLEATFPESVAPKPASHYGITKLAAEQLVLSASRNKKLSASSLRLYSVYGPRERPEKLYTKLIACGFKNETFPLFSGSEKHLRSFTYVGDIVDGIVKAVERYQKIDGEIINLGTEVEHTTQEGIATVEKILGRKIELSIVEKRPGDQWRTKAVIDKAKKLLDYNPQTTLTEGLEQQVKWYKTNFID
ncbi:NAD-dependent epimerase/dehydratase family protein [Mesonia aquimarina]|uniref:NAD-dependent epimerase/dehydratase family protein n=1 Tax=Mesonia aquimarina TaxID=1504967 RepID=UPI000EF5C1FC|nr:NAD-dependent epimerase/dehydratase family protein [Mesonia aquimarina]